MHCHCSRKLSLLGMAIVVMGLGLIGASCSKKSTAPGAGAYQASIDSAFNATQDAIVDIPPCLTTSSRGAAKSMSVDGTVPFDQVCGDISKANTMGQAARAMLTTASTAELQVLS